MAKRLNIFFWNLIEVVPILTTALVAMLGSVLVLLLLLGKMTNGLIVALLSVLIPLTVYAVWKIFPLQRPGSEKEKKLFDILVLLLVFSWVGFNVFYTARSVFIDRDPGIYTTTGRWLMENPTTDIAVNNPFGTRKWVTAHSSGIWINTARSYDDLIHLQPQGMHMLPAVLGVAGRIGGMSMLFAANVVLGGVALLSVYGFSRQMMKPRWAALATATLASSLPMIYFSRDTYNEPIALAFTFGALTLLWIAYQKLPNVSIFLWLLTGLVAGAGVLTRPDGYFTIIAIAGFMILAHIFTQEKLQRSIRNAGVLFLASAAPIMLLGFLDMSELTRSYYLSHGGQVRIQLALLAFTLVVGPVLAYVIHRKNYVAILDKITKNWRILFASCLIVFVALLFMSRPLWLKVMQPVVNGAVADVQQRQNMPIEPRRYIENTVEWMNWYAGAALVGLSIVGAVVAVRQVIEKQKIVYLAGILTVGFTAGLFLSWPVVTPDHIWASRRFLPVILPGIIIFGVFAISWFFGKYENSKRNKAEVFLFGLAIAFYIVMQPLILSRPFLRVAEKKQNYSVLIDLCKKLPENAAVLWVDESTLAHDAVHSVRTFCGVASMGYGIGDNTDPERVLTKYKLSEMSKTAIERGYEPYIVMHGFLKTKVSLQPDITNNMSPLVIYNTEKLERTLLNPPRWVRTEPHSIEIGLMKPDGSIGLVETPLTNK